MNEAAAWAELCGLLCDDPRLAAEVVLAQTHPAAYFDAFAEEDLDWFFESVEDVDAWFALLSGLTQRGLLATLDWKDRGEELAWALEQLPIVAGLRLDLTPVAETDEQIEEAAVVADQILAPHGLCLVELDAESDNYPLVVVPSVSADRIVNLSASLDQRARVLGRPEQGEGAGAEKPIAGAAVPPSGPGVAPSSGPTAHLSAAMDDSSAVGQPHRPDPTWQRDQPPGEASEAVSPRPPAPGSDYRPYSEPEPVSAFLARYQAPGDRAAGEGGDFAQASSKAPGGWGSGLGRAIGLGVGVALAVGLVGSLIAVILVNAGSGGTATPTHEAPVTIPAPAPPSEIAMPSISVPDFSMPPIDIPTLVDGELPAEVAGWSLEGDSESVVAYTRGSETLTVMFWPTLTPESLVNDLGLQDVEENGSATCGYWPAGDAMTCLTKVPEGTIQVEGIDDAQRIAEFSRALIKALG